MSLVIQVPEASRDADIARVRDQIDVAFHVVSDDGELTTGHWPEWAVVYRQPGTVRRPEVYWDDLGGLIVRLLTGSSPDDFYLGFRLAAVMAAETGSGIIADDADEPMDAENFAGRYDAEHSAFRAREMLGLGAI